MRPPIVLMFSLALALALPLQAIAGEPVTLRTADSVSLHGTLTQAGSSHHAIALLFHQARGNRHEYDAVVPTLTGLGYDTLAIDQRSEAVKLRMPSREGRRTFVTRRATAKYGEFGEPNDPDLAVARRRHGRSTGLAVGRRFFHSLSEGVYKIKYTSRH